MTSAEPIGAFIGGIHPEWDTPSFRAWLAKIPSVPGAEALDPSCDRVLRATPPGLAPLVLKKFPAEPLWKQRIDQAIGRGTRARRAFVHAMDLLENAVPTPRPIAWLERREKGCLCEQYLLTELLPGALTLRDALLHHYYEKPLCSAVMDLLQAAATAVRLLHDAGYEHRDLGNQNLLVARDPAGKWDKAWVIDLHRSRFHTPGLSEKLRGRDNARITLPSDLRRVFFEMQHAPAAVPHAFLRAEKSRRAVYALQTRSRPFRHPFRKRVRPVRDYPHERDIWIWDDRSMQAIPALRGKDKRAHYRRRDGLEMAGSLFRYGKPVLRACRSLMDEAFTQPVDLAGRVGLSLNLEPERFEKERHWLGPLGPLPLLVRLYHHETESRRRFAVEAVRKLQSEGHRVTVALVQDRRALLFPDKWREFVENAGGSLSGFVQAFEVCHAVNRVKWGVWSYAEHRTLMEPFRNWRDRYPQIPLIGPAGIDFEYPRVLPLIDNLPEGESWEALSHHLYVDRRGSPENKQSGYDTVRKLALARAIARVHPRCKERVIVSEVNWPLLGTGVWSPVGSPYQSPGERHNDPSVDEITYAANMLRYFLLALCSGMADRVYWWNLAAHGFGLIDDRDPKGWRPRPAYHEFKRFAETARDATFQRREDPDGRIRLHFSRRDSAGFHIEWDPRSAELPVSTFEVANPTGLYIK